MREIRMPNRQGQNSEETISLGDNLVIIGANGTGKSRLGLFIERYAKDSAAKRISAQRMLNLPTIAPMMNYEQSIAQVVDGYRNRQIEDVLNDYQSVMSALFAKTTKRDSEYVKLCQESNSTVKPPIPESTIEKLIRLWNDILPHRKIELFDNRIIVRTPDGKEYSGSQMSDGERVALYLISQCLIAPENYIIIIDEPELHLHKALMSRLWNRLENERNDCLFIYITHDLDFASSRVKANKIWVKSYADNLWTWDFVPDINEIPENLLLEIIGSRKPILFVEGEKGSYDHAIYQHFYPNFTIIPRDGCTKVIESTKGIKNNSHLHEISAFGLIDRDYRNDEEIAALKKQGILTVDVAEVENILLTPQIIKIVAEHLALDTDSVLNQVTEFVISSLSTNLEKEVSYASSLEVNFKLNALDNKQKGKDNIKSAVSKLVSSINIDEIYQKNYTLYKNIIETKDLKLALRHYTNKGLLPNVSTFFGLHGHEYSKLILRLIRTNKSIEIIAGLSEYLPSESNYS